MLRILATASVTVAKEKIANLAKVPVTNKYIKSTRFLSGLEMY